jgi:hypothetical protein
LAAMAYSRSCACLKAQLVVNPTTIRSWLWRPLTQLDMHYCAY